MANEAVYYGTGRRKNAIARVRLVPGTGKITVNGRDGKEYFGREALLNYASAPFKVTDTIGAFDVIARLNAERRWHLRSGRRSAPRHQPRSAPGWRVSPRAEEGWFPDPRRSYGRAQEVRSEEGPSSSAVQQALGCRSRRLFAMERSTSVGLFSFAHRYA